MARVTIPERFNGPPGSANGGFTCGLLAGAIGARAAEVSLRMPPPLDTELHVSADADGGRLLSGDDVVAEAKALPGVDVEPPLTVSVDTARAASAEYPWYETHIYPTCFVCGPDRPAHDGLEIFAGPVEDDRTVYAAAWTPAPEWAAPDGSVRDELVWAALDCPSAVPVMAAGTGITPAVLARLSASLERPVQSGEAHVVLAWALGGEGRKLHSASALVDADGAIVARALALWITLAAPMGSEGGGSR